MKYLYFQVGGVISRKEIINRLVELELDETNKNNFFHIDIFDNNEERNFINY